MLIKGAHLTLPQQRLVLAAFIYRWTRENHQRESVYGPCPRCDIAKPHVNTKTAEGHNHPTIPLQSDREWLEQHAFHFTQDGSRLMENRHFAELVWMAEEPKGQAGRETLSRHRGKGAGRGR